MKKNAVNPVEEEARKERVRMRVLILLVVLDLLFVGYLVFEMVSIFVLKK